MLMTAVPSARTAASLRSEVEVQGGATRVIVSVESSLNPEIPIGFEACSDSLPERTSQVDTGASVAWQSHMALEDPPPLVAAEGFPELNDMHAVSIQCLRTGWAGFEWSQVENCNAPQRRIARLSPPRYACGMMHQAIRSVLLTGADPVFPTPYRIGAAGAVAIAASAQAAADFWELRTGERQSVAVNCRHAAAAMRSATYLRIDGIEPSSSWDPFSGLYPTGDGRHVFLHCNFPHHREGMLALLGTRANKEEFAAAVAARGGQEFEDAIAAAGLCGALTRTPEEWVAHPHGRALAALPPVSIERIGDGPKSVPRGGGRPLAGIRVLDLTRVLAGPTCGRTLAEHGADVMRIAAPHLPFAPTLVMDTGHGKLSAFVDLREQRGRAQLRALASEADVFVQGYRPGTLAARGFGPRDIGPGKIYVSLSAYGHEGPFAPRRGFDSILQNASGMSTVQGSPEAPCNLPVQPLDYCAGYLAAWGVVTALLRRAEEGGSWHVQLSLAGMAEWIKAKGPVEGWRDAPTDLSPEELAAISMESDTPHGRLTHLAPVAMMSRTPPHWTRPSAPLGSHDPVWPETLAA